MYTVHCKNILLYQIDTGIFSAEQDCDISIAFSFARRAGNESQENRCKMTFKKLELKIICFLTQVIVLGRAYLGKGIHQYTLARLYDEGIGFKQSNALAHKWYFRSAKNGYFEAQYNWGLIIYEAAKNTEDYKHALYWFELAAKQQDEMALFNIGIMFYHGQGVLKDVEKAVGYFEKAAALGSEDATELLRQLNTVVSISDTI